MGPIMKNQMKTRVIQTLDVKSGSFLEDPLDKDYIKCLGLYDLGVPPLSQETTIIMWKG